MPTLSGQSVDAEVPSSYACGSKVLFAVFQTGNRANGGVESVSQIMERLRDTEFVVLTQRETPICDRWRAAGGRVVVHPVEYGGTFGRAHSTPTTCALCGTVASVRGWLASQSCSTSGTPIRCRALMSAPSGVARSR